jgi:galactokinase
VDALAADDRAAVGKLFAASHASLRDDYEVTVPQTDLLVELCRRAGAVAARMTGGGFGGSVVALVEHARAEALGREVVDGYRSAADGPEATAYHCRAGEGAGEVRGQR